MIAAVALRRTPKVLAWRHGVRPADHAETSAVLAGFIADRGLRGRVQPRVWVFRRPVTDRVTALTARDVAVSEPFLAAMLRGEVDIEEASAAAAFAVGWRRAAGGTGWQLIELVCLPWDIVEGIVVGLSQGRLAWRARPLFFALTMLQAAQAGRSWVAVAVATLGVLTYTHPWARRRWALQRQQAGDAEVIAQGLGSVYAQMVRRRSHDAAAEQRARQLAGWAAECSAER